VASWWYLTAGQPTGPVTDQQLVAMALNGALSPSSPVHREGDGDWSELARYGAGLGLSRNSWGSYYAASPEARGPEVGGRLSGHAGIGPRLLAFLLDYWKCVWLGLAAFVLALPALRAADSPAASAMVLMFTNLASSGALFAYEVISTAVRGQTRGKLRTDIEVVVATTAELPDLARSLLRALVKAVTVSGPWMVVGLVVWLVTPNRFTVHDWVAGTTVQPATY
jgi:uncharacterized RDD family membrane protein YckC